MFALIWGAVRTRTAQVLTVLILTALAASVAAAGPWFAVAASTRAAAADVAAAPAGERTLSVRKISNTEGDPQATLDQFGSTVHSQLPLPTSGPVSGMVLPLTTSRGTESPSMGIAYREDYCAHLLLQGPCPSAPLQVTISQNAAQQLSLAPGGTLRLRSSGGAEPIPLSVVSTYVVRDPAGTYWSNPLFSANGSLDPAFTPIGTFKLRQLWQPTVTYDVQVPDELIRGDGGYALGPVLRAADLSLGRQNLRLVNTAGPLLDAIAEDRAAIRRGVLVWMLQILVLAWFAIGLAGRYTGRDRRGDVALLKLRGSTVGATLRLAWGQHLVPLVLGALAGLPMGYLLAHWLAGPVSQAADRQEALGLSVAAVAAVLLGGLAVLAVLEALVLRRPVSALLRQVGGGRRDWRSGVVDLLLLAVAVAAVYQTRSGAAQAGVALAAPAMVALAVALLLARMLGRAADRGGGVALRTGHLRLGLTAVQVSRQPGTDRVFALIVVAVAGFATALGGWAGQHAARVERSGAELGASRVLTVQAPNRTALLQTVRRVDPSGNQAMAVVIDATSNPPVIAVDSARLAAVARWRPEFGPVGTLSAATAAAPRPEPLPLVTGDRLAGRVRYDGEQPVVLDLILQNEGNGAPVRAAFGRLHRGEQEVSAPVSGCSAAPGCRILRWEMTMPPDRFGHTSAPVPGTRLTLRGLDQRNPDAVLLDAARLGDIARWRPGTDGAALDLSTAGGVLRLTIDANRVVFARLGESAYAVDSALPMPAILAGPTPNTWQFAEPALFSLGGSPAPVRVAGTATALPALGRSGVLVDLDAARRIIGDASPPGEFQVWISDRAGPGIAGALEAAGLTITSDQSVTGRAAQLGEQGPAVISRFALVAGVVGLLLAAAAIGVAGAVDRRTRLEQLAALRLQGLGGKVAVLTAYAGMGVLVVAGLTAGLVAAAVARPLAGVVVPPFTDGWDVLPLPGALGPVALAAAGLIALVVLGATGWLAVLPLIRRLRREGHR